jgi:CspA family cold shock protein
VALGLSTCVFTVTGSVSFLGVHRLYANIYRQQFRAVISRFDSKRGFGFVALSNGSGRAFLHENVLARSGIYAVRAGDCLEICVNLGRRGLHVTDVIRIYPSSLGELGTVRFYKAHKGFGFIASDRGGSDIFVGSSALKRSEIATLSAGQRVIFDIAQHQTRREANRIRLC